LGEGRWILISEHSPARQARHNQDARRNRQHDLLASRSMDRLKLQEVTVAGTARAQVIEPFVCFG
jgi:hypothetical protein